MCLREVPRGVVVLEGLRPEGVQVGTERGKRSVDGDGELFEWCASGRDDETA